MQGEKVLVACSGGRDSIALASVLSRISVRCGFELVALAYVHHGPSQDRKIVAYRKKATRAVRKFAAKLDLDFVQLGPSPAELVNEQDLRRFRLGTLKDEARARGATAIAFAHHADDLFETRLIRLLRGTGPAGLEAMTKRKSFSFRPFLDETRASIAAYAKDQSLEWVEDPSNEDTKALRNWIRKELLPLLEAKRPGASSTMARSLALIVDELGANSNVAEMPNKMASDMANLDRPSYEALSFVERKRTLSRFVSRRGARDLTSNQIEEIVKRLSGFESRRRRSGTFVVMGLEWSISPKEITATRVLSLNVDVLS